MVVTIIVNVAFRVLVMASCEWVYFQLDYAAYYYNQYQFYVSDYGSANIMYCVHKNIIYTK